MQDEALLRQSRQRFLTGDPRLIPAAESLRTEAELALTSGPFSIVEKPFTPPGGDKRDYMSMGPYWWPNPDTAYDLQVEVFACFTGRELIARRTLEQVPAVRMAKQIESDGRYTKSSHQ